MSFHVRFDDVEVVDGYARAKLSAMQVQLDGIGSAIGALVSAPGFEGAAAGRARAYLGDVHGLLLSSLQTVLVEYQQLVLSYKDGLHTGVDSDPHAEFDEDALVGVESRMGVRAGEFEEQARELESAVESVSDLLSFFGPRNAGAVAGDVRQVGVWARQAREVVGEYEYAHRGDLVGVREQLGRIGAVLDQCSGGSVAASYDRAGLAGNAAVVALVAGDAGLVAGQQARAASMAGVFAREDDRLAVLDADAARERVKWGWVKAVGAVITIVVGVVAIVASAGAATPLVIGAAGVAATMFGASDLVEAGRDIRYGMQGDAYTRAGNPLRDTVFGGNQTLYDVVGFAVCAAAGAAIPLTQAARLGMVPRASVAGAVVREGVQDLGAQQVAAVAMPHLGAEGALAAAVLGGGAVGRFGTSGPLLPDALLPTVKGGTANIADEATGAGGHHGQRPRAEDIAFDWAEEVYDSLRADASLSREIAARLPEVDASTVDAALTHLLHSEHRLGWVGGVADMRRFDADPDIAEALLRLKRGEGSDLDRLLLRHEVAESEYMKHNPRASYDEAHAYANSIADWAAEMTKGD